MNGKTLTPEVNQISVEQKWAIKFEAKLKSENIEHENIANTPSYAIYQLKNSFNKKRAFKIRERLYKH